MIRLEHVSKTYQQGVPALNDVNIDIEQGEFVFIMGKSGSGKSTLLKIIAGLDKSYQGEVVSVSYTHLTLPTKLEV